MSFNKETLVLDSTILKDICEIIEKVEKMSKGINPIIDDTLDTRDTVIQRNKEDSEDITRLQSRAYLRILNLIEIRNRSF